MSEHTEPQLDSPLDREVMTPIYRTPLAPVTLVTGASFTGPVNRLVPSWSKEAKLGRMINARAETVHEKSSFRRAFKSRRLLVPISGFYEWFPTQQLGRSGMPLKQPFYLHPKDDAVLALAGLYEFWLDKSKAEDDPDRWLTTFTIITTTATDDVGHIHDRMPMTAAPETGKPGSTPGTTTPTGSGR